MLRIQDWVQCLTDYTERGQKTIALEDVKDYCCKKAVQRLVNEKTAC